MMGPLIFPAVALLNLALSINAAVTHTLPPHPYRGLVVGAVYICILSAYVTINEWRGR